MNTHQETQTRAESILREQHPRADYAAQVIRGNQEWSGADLKGKAKRYGGGYARQRQHSRYAWWKAGGLLLRMRRSGRIVSAVPVCVDDYGNQVFDTGFSLQSATDFRRS